MAELGFILSTGRTGTKFFEDYINETFHRSLCLHEPRPSRKYKFYSNRYLQHKMQARSVCKKFIRDRKDMLENPELDLYVESSNFIFGCIGALNTCIPGTGVVHIVRHPEKYIYSHLNHGFWKGIKKFTAMHARYWLENLHLEGKEKNDPVIILIRRWKYVNELIGSYERSNRYLCIRFEDLFSGERHEACEQLNRFRNFFRQHPLAGEENTAWLNSPKNISRKEQTKYRITPDHKAYMRDCLTGLLSKYKYEVSG